MNGESRALIWITAGALALRLGWVALRWGQAGASFEYDDERLHWELASNLVQRGALVSDDGRYAARMPVYPLLLAPFALAGPAGVLLARLAQAAIGAATVALAATFARQAMGRPAAVAAGALTALDPYAIFFSNLLLTEVLFTFIGLLLTYCAWLVGVRYTRPAAFAVLPRIWRQVAWANIGLATLGGVAVLTRQSSVGWVALLFVLVWWYDRERRRGTMRLIRHTLTVGLLLLPWGLRNHATLGAYAWLGTNGGATLYDGQGPQARGDSDQRFMQELPEIQGLGEIEKDRVLRRLAIEQMQRDPARALSLAWVKLARTWSLTPNVANYRLGATGLVSAVFMLALLALGVLGVRRLLASRRLLTLLGLPIVYFTLVHCVYVGSLRYRVPVMPFVELIAAGALTVRREKW